MDRVESCLRGDGSTAVFRPGSYAKHRRSLLRAGIELFEWRRVAHEAPARKRLRLGLRAGGSIGKRSAASLHAKTFSIDQHSVFVGSFNFDPRSARLNTEMGVVIDSPALACRIEAGLGERLAQTAWKVTLLPNGKLQWRGEHDGRTEQYAVEPDTRAIQRLAIRLLSLLPIEWLL
ncbi:MAG: hypothetical protein JSS44_01650 [Proteobacteria bacterium]|nr:hypothetical protein [Pseudomonadota bacterium]MBS0462973.1 hypothetical protein [Pseudomonadota bacterium]MBS0463909.1 hypothetical protein [Pseudomonadota bacterium]